MKLYHTALIAPFVLAAASVAQAADDDTVLVGDPVHGRKVYAEQCAACHGNDGGGGRSGYALTDSGRMNLIRDSQMFAMVETGKGLQKPDEHTLKDQLEFLEIWDVVSHVRTRHLTLGQLFPTASRYVNKRYTIDEYGLKRIEDATGKKLQGNDRTAAVFTFFEFEGEEGNLRFVPQDPILLDQLDKDKKVGYLVFLPFSYGEVDAELGVAMDGNGKIVKLLVHEAEEGAAELNEKLAKLEGMGRKGQKKPFDVPRSERKVKPLADAVFPIYLRAMETVTMYDREERERTWAD